MDKYAIAMVLEEIATLLEASGENRFKARAFRSAARALEKSERDPRALIATDALRDVPGIGPATARIIEELVVTGESSYLLALRERAPSGLRELLRVPGLGPKKIAQLHQELGIADLDALEAAARSGRIASVRGFGARTQQRVLDGIAFARGLAGRRRYHEAELAALRLAGFLDELAGIERTYIAGSLRRGLEIVEGIVLVSVLCGAPARIAARIRAAAGPTWYGGDDRTIRGRFGDGLPVEVRLVERDRLGAELLQATGSAAHIAAVGAAATARGLQLTPDGLRDGDALLSATGEDAIYDALGMQTVPPELRETGEEVALARAHALPRLVELEDLRGCFHCHTTHSDGRASVEEMAEGALALGWRYLGIADHSRNAGYAGGLQLSQIRRQHREIDAWNRRRGVELRLFKGIEADILADGTLDYAGDAGVLESFDFVIGSIHSLFRMDQRVMTERIERAVGDPRLTMLGHPRGRLLLIRDGYDVDIEAVIERAAECGAAIEINADPHRLDMSWQHWPRARELGVRTAINPDAHSVSALRVVRYGVNIARKAWLAAGDVINTWPLEDVEQYLEERRQRRSGKAG
ncbi:MAG TPA: DNA polymerase/3'-5' exonuclease PolX [Longimicrobiales bacterium]